MVDGLRTWVSRGLHSSVATGPAFEEFASRVVAAGYVITSVSFPASRCRSMQSRLRLFMFTTRSDVVDALGPFTLPTLPQLQHQPIESLLRADPLSFDIIAPASSLVLLQKPSEFRQHLPHLLGYFEGSQVWAVSVPQVPTCWCRVESYKRMPARSKPNGSCRAITARRSRSSRFSAQANFSKAVFKCSKLDIVFSRG